MQRLSPKFHFLILLLGIFFVTQTTYASEVGYEQHVLFTYGLSELELSVEGMGEAPGQKIVLSGEDISGLSVNNAELDYSLPETEVALFPKSSPERNDYEFWNIQGTYQGHLFLILGYEIAYDGDEDSFFQKNIDLLMDGAKILLLLMLFGILCFFFKRKSWLMALMCLVLTSCSTEYLAQEQRDEPEAFAWTFEGNSEYEIVLDNDYTAPTAEQLAWFEQHVYDVLEQAANNYPVLPVRDLLRTVLEAEGEAYRVMLSAQSAHVDTVASASHHDKGPEPTIMFYLPVLMDWYSYYDRPEDYEVALIAAILHEYRHTQQDWGDIFDEPAPDWVTFGRESDAQWFIAENVLKPMEEGGQLDSIALTNYSDSFTAYLMANGDQNDPEWQAYVVDWTDFEDFPWPTVETQ